MRDNAIKVQVHIIMNTYEDANECANDNYIVQQIYRNWVKTKIGYV